jgi:hypothetical protein
VSSDKCKRLQVRTLELREDLLTIILKPRSLGTTTCVDCWTCGLRRPSSTVATGSGPVLFGILLVHSRR